MLLEKTLESPLDIKEIKPVSPKGNQPWILIGRTDSEAEAPVVWPSDSMSRLIWKDPDAGKDWRQEEKGMAGWDGWMASPTQWTWVWANSGSWWWTGKPGVLQSMRPRRARRNLTTERQQWKKCKAAWMSASSFIGILKTENRGNKKKEKWNVLLENNFPETG